MGGDYSEVKQGGRLDLESRTSGSATLQNALGPEFWESETLSEEEWQQLHRRGC